MPELSSSLPSSSAPVASARRPPPLPTVTSELSVIEVVGRLDEAARRGRLPGFAKSVADATFQLADFGAPFESILSANGTPSGSGCELRFSLRLKPLMPWIFFILLVLTVWPGVWLTDSLLKTYFSGYCADPHKGVQTWMWYVPLTILCIPLSLMPALSKSRRTARTEALVLIEKIRALVGAPATTADSK